MTAAPDSAAELKRISREIAAFDVARGKECRKLGHDWRVMLHPVSLAPKERICARCIRKEVPFTLWLKQK